MIGIFDSGLGGLTVLKEVKKALPDYNYIYLGDTLHVPYGNRSDEAVYELSKKACDFLFDQGCKLIIIACNTATAKALRKLQQEYLPEKKKQLKNARYSDGLVLRRENINILGVVRPVVESFSKNGGDKIAVIATTGTINSKIYEQELLSHDYKGKIKQKATPLLVPLIEENWLKKSVTRKILRMYLNVLKLNNVSSIILGCTHYPILLNLIKNIMGKSCYVPNPAEIVANSLSEYLKKHQEIELSLLKEKQTKYFVTDLNENFNNVARIFIQEKIKIEKVNLK